MSCIKESVQKEALGLIRAYPTFEGDIRRAYMLNGGNSLTTLNGKSSVLYDAVDMSFKEYNKSLLATAFVFSSAFSHTYGNIFTLNENQIFKSNKNKHTIEELYLQIKDTQPQVNDMLIKLVESSVEREFEPYIQKELDKFSKTEIENSSIYKSAMLVYNNPMFANYIFGFIHTKEFKNKYGDWTKLPKDNPLILNGYPRLFKNVTQDKIFSLDSYTDSGDKIYFVPFNKSVYSMTKKGKNKSYYYKSQNGAVSVIRPASSTYDKNKDNVLFELNRNYNILEVLHRITPNLTKEGRVVANILSSKNVTVNFTNSSGKSSATILGNAINFTLAANHLSQPYILIHELTHMFLYTLYYDIFNSKSVSGDFSNRVSKLINLYIEAKYKDARREIKKDIYGLTDEPEFLAELLSGNTELIDEITEDGKFKDDLIDILTNINIDKLTTTQLELLNLTVKYLSKDDTKSHIESSNLLTLLSYVNEGSAPIPVINDEIVENDIETTKKSNEKLVIEAKNKVSRELFKELKNGTINTENKSAVVTLSNNIVNFIANLDITKTQKFTIASAIAKNESTFTHISKTKLRNEDGSITVFYLHKNSEGKHYLSTVKSDIPVLMYSDKVEYVKRSSKSPIGVDSKRILHTGLLDLGFADVAASIIATEKNRAKTFVVNEINKLYDTKGLNEVNKYVKEMTHGSLNSVELLKVNNDTTIVYVNKDGTQEILNPNMSVYNLFMKNIGIKMLNNLYVINPSLYDRNINLLSMKEDKDILKPKRATTGEIYIPLTNSNVQFNDDGGLSKSILTPHEFKDVSDSISVTGKYGITLFKKLQKHFERLGIYVELRVNTDMNESANVRKDDKTGITYIEINPILVQKDTIFHEFGHILVELAADREFILNAIDELRGTKLWNKIANKYRDKNLDDYTLGKEVLTTLIGSKASDYYGDSLSSKIKFIIDRFIIRIAKALNIKYNVAKDLAIQLVNTNVTLLLNEQDSFDKQYQLVNNQIDHFVNNYSSFLTDSKNILNTIRTKYKNAVSTGSILDKVDTLEVFLESDFKFGQLDSLFTDMTNLIQLRKFFRDSIGINRHNFGLLYNEYIQKNISLTSVSKEDVNDFGNSLMGLRTLVSMYEPVKNIDVIKLEEIEKFKSEINEAFGEDGYELMLQAREALEKMTSLTPMIQKFEQVLVALYDKYNEYLIASTTNPEAKDKSLEYIVANMLIDENMLQKFFTSGFDSPNILTANINKFIRLYKEQAKSEISERRREFYEMFDKHGNFDIRTLFDSTGRLHRKYLYDKVKKDISAAKKESTKNEKIAYKNESFGEFLKRKGIIKFYSNPVEVQKGIKKARESMSRERFRRFMKDNLYVNNQDAFTPVLGSVFAPYETAYVNPEYGSIMNNENTKIMYEYLRDLLYDLTSHVKYAPQQYGTLPSVAAKFEDLERDITKLDVIMTDGDGFRIFNLPFHYIGYVNSKPTIGIPHILQTEDDTQYEKRILERTKRIYNMEFNSIFEIQSYNKHIQEENKKRHGELVDYNIKKTIPLFIETAIMNRTATQIEGSVLSAIASMRQADIIKHNSLGKQVFELFKVDKEGKNKLHTIKGYNAKSWEHLAKQIEMTFYDHFLTESKFNKPLQVARDYVSYNALGLNIFAAGKNVSFGMSMIENEAIAGRFFNRKQLRGALKDYNSNILNLIADSKDGTYKYGSKISAIINTFNMIEDFAQLLEKSKPNRKLNRKFKYFNDAMFILTNTAEHMMHNVPLLAMMKSHRIVNGRIINLSDYIDANLVIPSNIDKDRLKSIREKVKADRLKLKEEFEKNPTLFDSLDFEDGNVTISKNTNGENVVSSDELNSFKLRVEGVNHKLHGVYNKEDKGVIEHYILGQLFMQFKHWAIPGWTKRFGADGIPFKINKVWNERRQEYDLGDYNVFFKHMLSPFTTSFNNITVEHPDQALLQKVAGAMIQGFSKYIGLIRLNWVSMSEDERAGVLRTLSEFATVMLVIWLGIRFKDWEEERRKKSKYILSKKFDNFISYELDAIRMELSTYLPITGWRNQVKQVLKTPTAVYGYADRLYQISTEILRYPFIDGSSNYIRSGSGKGQLKFIYHSKKMFPVWSQKLRFDNLDHVVKYYKQQNYLYFRQ